MNIHHGGAAARAILAVLAVTVTGCSQGAGSATADPPATASSPPAVTSAAAAAALGTQCSGSGVIRVSSAGGLHRALAGARPGATIVLAPGTYDGNFTASRSGTPTAPVTLCGPRGAVLDGGDISHGYTLHLDHASWWRVEGFTVEGGQKGVVADGSDHDLFYGLSVHSTGDEAIHLRDFSSHDTISHCVVGDTGLLMSFFGEGIYVGSAHKNWCRYSGCQPDASDDNVIEDNTVSGTTAENIDIKEGTTGGQITGNHFDGTGMVGSAATAWINVKGNNWTITGNTGVDSIGDGFQVHQVYPGWGIGNVFRANVARVNGPGYGFYVQSKRLRTVVACDNRVIGAARGFSTIACRAAL